MFGCKPVKTTGTKLKDVDKPFEKFLVIEEGDEHLGDVMNKLRVEMMRQFYARAEVKFKRTKILSLDPSGEIEAGIKEHQPDALLFLRFSDTVRSATGANGGSIKSTVYHFALHRADTREKVWEGQIKADRSNGVETASQSIVRGLLEQITAAGMLRKLNRPG